MSLDIIDKIRLLQQSASSHNVAKLSGWLDTALFAILSKQKQEGQLGCLLIAAAGPLTQDHCYLGLSNTSQGVYRFTGTVGQIKETLKLLHDIGYSLWVYPFLHIEPVVRLLDEIPAARQDKDPLDLVSIGKALPSCHTYVELFGGSAPMLYCRNPAPVEVCNDLGSFVVDFARTLRDPGSFNEFFILSRVFPLSLPMDPLAVRKSIHSVQLSRSSIARSFAWYHLVRIAYCAAYDSLADEAKEVVADESSVLLPDLRTTDRFLPQIHGRLLRVQYEHNDYLSVVNTFDSGNTLFWVDVPENFCDTYSFDELHGIVDRLNKVEGTVALYLHNSSAGSIVSNELQSHKGWHSVKFRNSTVLLNHLWQEVERRARCQEKV